MDIVSDQAREFLAQLVVAATEKWTSPWVILTPAREPLVDELRNAGVDLDILASEPVQVRFRMRVLA